MRSRIVRVRTSDTEFSRMKDIATARGLSISEMIRRAALGTRMLARTFDARHVAMLARTLSEVGRVGGNLNQLVRLANSGRIAGRDDDLSRSFMGLQAALVSGLTPDTFAAKAIEAHVAKELKGRLRAIEKRYRPEP